MFAWMLGLKNVWGVEFDVKKVWKADTAIRRTLAEILSPPHIVTNGFYLEHIEIERVHRLPDGSSIIFSFWQGLDPVAKRSIGKLATECKSFRILCLVQYNDGYLHEDLEHEFGFPQLNLDRKSVV